MNKILLIGLFVLVLIGIGGYLLYSDMSATKAPSLNATNQASTITQTATPNLSPVPTNQEESSGTPSEKQGTTVTVEGKNFSFSPGVINAKKGIPLTIHFTNVGGFHDFVIDEFNVKTPQIAEGKTADVTFTPDKSGTFEFYCSVGKHREMGMKGSLIVEE